MKKFSDSKTVQHLAEKYNNSNKASVVVYVIVRAAIITVMLRQIFIGEWQNVFLCGLSLLLLFIPFFLRSTFKINFPSILEITVFIFVFAAEILGEMANFYNNIPFWDTMLHTVTGFLAASVGFGMIDLLNRHSKRIHMTPLFVALVSFCFSMTVGVVWEFSEYAVDRLFGFDTQKDEIVTDISSVMLHPEGKNEVIEINGIEYTVVFDAQGNELGRIDGGYLDVGLHDTIKDMWVNLLGAVVFSTMGFLYIHRRDKYTFAENFIITPLEDTKDTAEKEPQEHIQ